MKLNYLLASSAIAVTLAFSSAEFVEAGFDEAVQAYEAGDYKTALNEWMALAEKNDAAAMRNIGHLYRRGLGTEQNYERAMHWYKRASEFGFERAQANVASMYLRGQGVDQDYVQAAEWFTKAARNGHVIAQYNLGLMYENGKGVEKSVSKALAWYNLAAKAGHRKALDKLSLLVATEPEIKVQEAEQQVASELTKKPAQTPTQTAEPTPTVAPKTAVAPAPQVVPAPKPKEVATATAKQKVDAIPRAKPAPVIVQPKAETAPVVKPTPTPKKAEAPKTEMPKVEAKGVSEVAKAPAVPPQPVASVSTPASPAKRDPFAGSANNQILTKENKGMPTAFNNTPAPKSVTSETAPAVTAKATPQPATPKSVDTQSLTKSTPSVPTAAPSAEVASVSVPKQLVAVPTVEPESKGFFGSLKSLVMGDDEDTDKVENATPKTVAIAPASAIEAPKPKDVVAPVERVAPGSGLSVAERLEMAELSFSVAQYQQALSLWAPLAKEGNPAAQFHLGQMFNEGFAVPVDRVKAHHWWSQAKSNGSTKAAASLEQLDASLTYIEKQQLQADN